MPDDHGHHLAAETLARRFEDVRARTLALIQPLSPEDCCVQSMPDASPAKWHLAHTTWFFETFVLERFEPGFRAYAPGWRVLFNSYYQTVGAQHARCERGLLTRPSLGEVIAYRRAIDERISTLLMRAAEPELLELIELGIEHEQQHQELIVTDIKHLLSRHPLAPAYDISSEPTRAEAPALRWLSFDGGLVDIGANAHGFSFDNERPRHRAYVAPFEIASRLTTNAEYAAFVDDGGYRDTRWWLAEGWDWIQREHIIQPLYWRGDRLDRREFTLRGEHAIDPSQPVSHLSYYEADAFARWSEARLPTEFEWEHAFACEEAAAIGAMQRIGACWQWTSSSYAPYPGFRPARGAVGEYNGKFMVNQYVLRGGSSATPPGHARLTYRNFFPTHARWQLSGVRLARDLSRA
ncbi:MAG TPA: ergothioneine biosynthesis protein EgtB [Burkholderiaceae bacterium]|nr:ergothioneine biosynthesis protein EgtB [Burkholderiaceae bacterium]